MCQWNTISRACPKIFEPLMCQTICMTAVARHWAPAMLGPIGHFQFSLSQQPKLNTTLTTKKLRASLGGAGAGMP